MTLFSREDYGAGSLYSCTFDKSNEGKANQWVFVRYTLSWLTMAQKRF